MNKYFQNQSVLEELVSITSERLGLVDPYVVEKDLYVTLAIETLMRVEDSHFKLIFQGGTCLAKAHRIVKRMSEDCDFRIVQRNPAEIFSKEQQRRYLRNFRKQLISSLQQRGFTIDDASIAVRNEGQFIEVLATYPSIFPMAQVLKPHLALEFFLGELQLPGVEKTVTTLVRQTLGEKIDHPEFLVEVMSMMETAAEKWVALTRRVATMSHRQAYQDQSLVRHLYDLYQMHEHGALTEPFSEMVVKIIQQDREQFKTHNLKYYEDPKSEIKRALDELREDPKWRQYWDEFIQTMVFDAEKPTYDDALKNFLKQTSGIEGYF